MSVRWFLQLAICLLVLNYVSAGSVHAQAVNGPSDEYLQNLQYRSIGPFRGGRSAAVEGIPGKRDVFFMGACGGGVWKTEDGGGTWENISDGFFGGSIGAVAVAPSNHNIIYVGGGEKTVRGNVSSGEGMYKSVDAGKNWKHIGLADSRHITRIRIDPRDANRVFVSALGHLYGPNAERGVFRTDDGGETWKRILHVGDDVGAVDLILDPNDPKTLFASTWRVLRTPYSLESGGPGSGLWKSIDGGDTWTEITRNSGLPQGTVGIIGVTVSPVDSKRVWAIIEAEDGGLFRSDDSGATWKKINEDRNLRQRAWYYTRIYAGPQDVNEVYVLNVQFWKSKDGGTSFTSIGTPHGDHHDLWIAPEDPQRMIIGDDGGAQVTFDGGKNFSTYHNQPTSQFYRVITDNHFPYRIYGAQQDNSTVRIAHRGTGAYLSESDWESTAGGESGHLAPDPLDPEVVYGGSYGGYLQRLDHRRKHSRNITVWPDNPIGYGAGDIPYRFQWNFPLFFSPANPKRLYAAANVLFVSEDEGHSWTPISPDLTRNDQSKLGPSGGPITKDNTSVEYYCTIFAAAESHHDPQTIWTGSDDGLIHLTRDGGKNWTNVTPANLPEWSMINSIEVHPTEPGGLYVAATRYKLDDFRPYLYKTLDYGASWTKIDAGIPETHFTRVVRADPNRKGLLYAGTENGMYVSFDDGGSWRTFQNNLPITPITDLTIKNGDLIVATQGRSFWVIDDLSLLHVWEPGLTQRPVHLFPTRPVHRIGGGRGEASKTAGANLKSEMAVRFWLDEATAKNNLLSVTLTDPFGNVAHRFASKPESGESKLEAKAGLNTVAWNMQYPEAEKFEGMILWGGGTQGPKAAPGTYRVELQVGDQVQRSEVELLVNPTLDASVEDLQTQFQFLVQVRDKVSQIHRAIKKIRELRVQLEAFKQRFGGNESYQPLLAIAEKLLSETQAIEEALYQTKNRSSQDPLNFPIRLNNRISYLASVAGHGDNRPTVQVQALFGELTALADAELEKLQALLATQVPEFNQKFLELSVPYLLLPDESANRR
jgi:photosystem II stability/assembly factor-like uncharacterized protein